MNSLDSKRVELTLIASLVVFAELSNLKIPSSEVISGLDRRRRFGSLDSHSSRRRGELGIDLVGRSGGCRISSSRWREIGKDAETQVLDEVILVDGERVAQMVARRVFALVPDNDCVWRFSYQACQLNRFIRVDRDVARLWDDRWLVWCLFLVACRDYSVRIFVCAHTIDFDSV